MLFYYCWFWSTEVYLVPGRWGIVAGGCLPEQGQTKQRIPPRVCLQVSTRACALHVASFTKKRRKLKKIRLNYSATISSLKSLYFRQYGYKYADINPLMAADHVAMGELEAAIFGLLPNQALEPAGQRCARVTGICLFPDEFSVLFRTLRTMHISRAARSR